jgi:hypothetical protein
MGQLVPVFVGDALSGESATTLSAARAKEEQERRQRRAGPTSAADSIHTLCADLPPTTRRSWRRSRSSPGRRQDGVHRAITLRQSRHSSTRLSADPSRSSCMANVWRTAPSTAVR